MGKSFGNRKAGRAAFPCSGIKRDHGDREQKHRFSLGSRAAPLLECALPEAPSPCVGSCGAGEHPSLGLTQELPAAAAESLAQATDAIKSSPKGHTVIPASPLLTPVSCEAPLHPLLESLRGNVLYPWVACQDARAGGTWAGQLRGKLPPQSGCQSEGCCRDRGPRGPTMMGPLGASGCEFQLHRNSLRVRDSSAVTAGD